MISGSDGHFILQYILIILVGAASSRDPSSKAAPNLSRLEAAPTR